MSAKLYYFHDPMCSWCYAFQAVWQVIKTGLKGDVEVVHVLGGLAADDDTPMSPAMQQTIQHHWRRIQQVVPGTEFNFDFWSRCKPRRATWPACRAVIAAAKQQPAKAEAMIEAIQRAYYREARNPSDPDTLVALAGELGLDQDQFQQDLDAPETRQALMRQVEFTRSMNVQGFPSLVLEYAGRLSPVPIDYTNATVSMDLINAWP